MKGFNHFKQSRDSGFQTQDSSKNVNYTGQRQDEKNSMFGVPFSMFSNNDGNESN